MPALGPVVGIEDRFQASGRAVPPLEADWNDGADGPRDAKNRCQKHDRRPKVDDVLDPRRQSGRTPAAARRSARCV